jgi:hypothetical protein
MTKFKFHFACIALMATALLSCSDDAGSPAPNGPEIQPPSSSSEMVQPVSSSSVESSSTQVSHNSFPVYEFKNAPTPSKGCGKTYTLDNEVDYINGSTKRYNITSAGQKRAFYMDLPDNYDNTKPYKILFANHFMGASAKEIAITENSVTFFPPTMVKKSWTPKTTIFSLHPKAKTTVHGATVTIETTFSSQTC